MSDLFDLAPSTIHRGLQGATPLLLAATGELVAERAGLVNIGIEGMMLVGALAGAAVGWASGSAIAGLLAGAAAGALVGLLFALWTVGGARDQIVTGLAINLLALGITGVAAERIDAAARAGGGEFVAPRFTALLSIDASAHPLLHALFAHDVITWLALPLVVLTAVGLRCTRPGLTLRAVGENPEAADTAGVRVAAARALSAVFGGACAGAAGACLTLSISNRFQDGMTDGRGFVALALVIFGRWSAIRIALAALFFGGLEALQVTLQPRLGSRVHVLYPAMLALPYVLTLLALALRSGHARPPAGLAIPYQRG